MSKIRTFIAVEIPNDVRDRIAELQTNLAKSKERIRWTKPDNIHVTLKFLGDIEQDKTEPIADAIRNATRRIQPFELSVKGLGAFPNLRRARVIWVGLENPSAELETLAQTLEGELTNLGFPSERRKFNPHLTIGRVKSSLNRQFIETLKSFHFESGQALVDEIILMKSDLKPTGALYTPLQRVPLSPH